MGNVSVDVSCRFCCISSSALSHHWSESQNTVHLSAKYNTNHLNIWNVYVVQFRFRKEKKHKKPSSTTKKKY